MCYCIVVITVYNYIYIEINDLEAVMISIQVFDVPLLLVFWRCIISPVAKV